MQKKAQIKIQEMAFVLVAIFIVFGLIILIFFRFQTGAWSQAAEEVRERRTISLLDKVSSMPELNCGSSLTTKSSCIDETKLQYMCGEFSAKYKKTWKNVLKIEVERLYPKDQTLKNIYTIYEDAKFGEEDISYSSYSNIISLCKYTAGGYECDIARLAIYMEDVEK